MVIKESERANMRGVIDAISSVIEVDHSQMMPGDILEYRCPNFGIVWQWRVHGLYGGGEKQEGLVEVSPVMGLPGSDAKRAYPKTMVPEPMTRGLLLIKETHSKEPKE